MMFPWLLCWHSPLCISPSQAGWSWHGTCAPGWTCGLGPSSASQSPPVKTTQTCQFHNHILYGSHAQTISQLPPKKPQANPLRKPFQNYNVPHCVFRTGLCKYSSQEALHSNVLIWLVWPIHMQSRMRNMGQRNLESLQTINNSCS